MRFVTYRTSNDAGYIYNKLIHQHDAIGKMGSYTYLILGRPGPTGKTWLTNALAHRGLAAMEITEGLLNVVDYGDDINHVIIDHDAKYVLIILNKPISKGE